MPTFTFECPNHGFVDEVYSVRPIYGYCPECNQPVRYDLTQTFRGHLSIIGDLPEHWNYSLDEPVRSRQHLRDISRERGVQEYEPTKGRDKDTELHRHWLKSQGKSLEGHA